jgi:hypothetical protein
MNLNSPLNHGRWDADAALGFGTRYGHHTNLKWRENGRELTVI